MTSSELARTSYKLLGAILIVHFLAGLADSAAARPLIMVGESLLPSNMAMRLFLSLGIFALFGVIFALLPGIYLLRNGERLADRHFPPAAIELHRGQTIDGLLPILSAVLGLYFLIRGVSGAVGGSLILLLQEDGSRFLSARAWETLGSSIALALGGLGVFLWGRAPRNAT